MPDRDELLIWSEDDGAWSQYYDFDNRRWQVCHLGFCDTLAGLRQYGHEHDIPVKVFPTLRSPVAERPAARAAGAQRQGYRALIVRVT